MKNAKDNTISGSSDSNSSPPGRTHNGLLLFMRVPETFKYLILTFLGDQTRRLDKSESIVFYRGRSLAGTMEVITVARGRPFVCPYCGTAGQTIQKGFRRTKTLGLRKIRLCKKCHRKFTPKNQKTMDQEQIRETE